MQAIIQDNSWLRIEQLPPHHEGALIEHFSRQHPRAQYINDTAQQSWDGWYRKYNSAKQKLARPLLKELKLFCDKHDMPLSVIDRRPEEEHPVDKSDVHPGLLEGITLEDHQMRAIYATLENECGLISAPTGAGKTEMMAAITKLFNLPTVILADQRIVIEQIKERLELRQVGDEVNDKRVGMFYGGEMPSGQMVVVGSIQSLCSPPASLKKKNPAQYKARQKNAKLFQAIVAQSKLLLVDECDKASDNRYRKLFMKYYTGRYKFGFSGTCFDPAKPVEGLKLKEHLGSIIIEISRKELEKIGRIIPIKAMMIAVGKPQDRQDRTAYDIAEKECMVENEEYHDRIRKIVQAYKGERNLILVDTNAIEGLGKALEKKIDGSVFIFGKSSKKLRKEALMAFEDGKLSALIGSKILKRGLDIKGGIHNLIICGGGKLSSDFNQKVGRAVRNNDRGWARLICFYHMDNFYLYRHTREQLKTIVSLGYKCNVSLGKLGIVDAEELIKRNFRLPKPKR